LLKNNLEPEGAKMLNLISAAIVLLLSFSAWSLESLKLGPGRYVTVESHIVNPKDKVLILLPGVYRGFDSRDVFIQTALKQNFNFVSLNYSLQPESLRRLKTGEAPYFQTHHYTREDLANEVRAVLKKYKIEKPVLAGTSYSSSVSTQLLKRDRFSLVIETSPMMRFDETDPETVAIMDFWKDWLRLNPFAGEELSRNYLLNCFNSYWAPKVDDLLKTYPQYRKPGFREMMIAGYSQMSLVAEGFDFADQNLAVANRFFILGENEDPNRFKLQLETIKNYEKITGQKDKSIIVKNAGHVVQNDAPEVYLGILRELLH
jgi:pimeloyl-ACP methyl ester carboxylesterase